MGWLGWDSLSDGQQFYVAALSGYVLGGWSVLTVEVLFGGRHLSRRRRRKKGRRR